MVAGEELFSKSAGSLSEEDMMRPSLLEAWTRKHVVAHVVANASALGNLVTWSKTGHETPMYRTPEERLSGIELGAALPGPLLLARLKTSQRELSDAMSSLTDAHWSTEVVTAQGRTVPASQIPWMRAREVCVHAVDLDAGAAFSDLSEGFLLALCDEIVAWRSARNHPGVRLQATDNAASWTIDGDDQAGIVANSLANIAAYLAGRLTLDRAPTLPAWI